MRFIITFLVFLVAFTAQADDWGKTGHRATGAIAEQYLNKKARKAIAQLLDGESLALVSTYADDIKSDTLYRAYGPQHYVNVPFDKTYDTHPHSEKGDIIQAIDHCIATLKSDTATKEEKAFQLRLLVHFIGDLHQPLHTGISEDKGGNDFQVRWYRDGTNLHRVWDSQMIESYGMSYSELAMNMPQLSKKERKTMASGTHRDWLEDSRIVVKDIYANTTVGQKLGYRYMYDYFDVLKGQLQKGGVRLAALLNEVLG
ncbi:MULTISPECIES: S1/P1 nuclease [Nonlabens]|uniref:S1/P1 nuclease n=2 Tax=Nonlabens ulvanivorans TaxID=906888 RepID=A0A084JX13_NONUL|nr:S1/P1 nuclease [Nonlabens ulvanivorans]KEZ93497.1 S1/P1 Nuclease [Nonlabens ulvanivorans]PRX14090.1 S1/P1 nuclease [Nonlabens ulvanivorans]